MRTLDGIILAEVVLHDVDPGTQSATLSEATLTLGVGAADFMVDHVSNGLDDRSAKAARFVAGDGTADVVRAVLDGTLPLLDGSRAMATSLAAMIPKSLPACTLAFVTFTASSHGGHTFFGLLKLDPNDTYATTERTNEDGQTVLDLERRTGGLPTPQQRLQKSVFAAPDAFPTETPALLLDKVTRPPAAYWQDFLGAAETIDAAESTSRFLRAVRTFAKEHADELGGEGQARLSTALAGAIAQEAIDAESFAENAVAEPLRNALRATYDEHLPNREFEVEGRRAGSAPPLVFRGEHDFRVSVDGRHFDDVFKEITPLADGRTVRVVLEVKDWRPDR